MCLIIHKKAEQRLSAHELSHVWDRNSDGWGILYLRDGKPVAEKGMALAGLITAYEGASDVEMFLHFRFATHGTKSEENLHPFEVLPGLWMLHNGIINIAQNVDKARSDTWHFAE